MNWLAHAFLSPPNADFRLGNLLADIVKGRDLDGMPPDFLAGARSHKAIDAFTGSHPVQRRGRTNPDAAIQLGPNAGPSESAPSAL
jgi:acyl carrier protein phosphodiesterase